MWRVGGKTNCGDVLWLLTIEWASAMAECLQAVNVQPSENDTVIPLAGTNCKRAFRDSKMNHIFEILKEQPSLLSALPWYYRVDAVKQSG